MALAWKASVGHTTGGSNPPLSVFLEIQKMGTQVILAALKEDFPGHDFDFIVKEDNEEKRSSKLTIDGKEVKVILTHNKSDDEYKNEDCHDVTDASDKVLYDVVIKDEVKRMFDSEELALSS